MIKNFNYSDNYILKAHMYIDNNPNTLLNNPYITAMGQGYKIINGKNTKIPSITFLVKKKLPKYAIHPQYYIPKYINDIITDVLEDSIFELSAFTDRPAYSGLSVANSVGSLYGTITYPVTDGGRLLLLSCSHVLYCPDCTSENKYAIIHPSKEFGGIPPTGSLKNNSYIGELVDWEKLKWADKESKLKPELANSLDAAIAYIGENNSITRTTLLSPYLKVGSFNEILNVLSAEAPRLYSDVWFITANRVHRLTGKIALVNTSAKITFQDKFYLFKNQIVVRNLSSEIKLGDSGSLGLHASDNSAFGMLIAKNLEGSAVFSPLIEVLDRFKVKLALPGDPWPN